MMRIIVVEDEAELRRPLIRALEHAGHVAQGAGSIAEAWDALVEAEPDLVVLDVMLPEGEDVGFRFAEALRATGFSGPILFITARDAVEDRVRGLDLGGDDYLVKPFSLEEFTARVRALLRRGGSQRKNLLDLGPIEIDLARREVRRLGRAVKLSPKEWALLELFALHPGRVFSAEELLDRLFPGTASGNKIVQVYVHRLREKLGDEVIRTASGGYVLGET